MKVLIYNLGELQTNVYLTVCEKTKECLIIDPADDANFIVEKVLQLQLKPTLIVATHGHFDHILAANELQMAFKIPFVIHKDDEKIVSYMNKSAQWWLKRRIVEQPPKINKFLEEGQKVKVGNESLAVLYTPGHTPGGVCLYNSKEKIIFTGDTLFSQAVGRSDLSYGSLRDLRKSLLLLTKKLSGFTAYPGHGKSFII